MCDDRKPGMTTKLTKTGNADVVRLAIAQALAGANAAVVYATGGIIGNVLAPSPALVTLPISILVVGMALCTLPVGAIARRYGRRVAFIAGTSTGVMAGLIGTAAILNGSFWLYCVATFLSGAYAAVVLSFRFAAADCVPADRRPRAMSLVMAGGVFAGVLGPQLVTHTMDLWQPFDFAATYLAQAAAAALSAVVLLGVDIPKSAEGARGGGRPLAEIVRQPRFVIAVISGIVSYLLMNFLMTAAPLAMRMCGLSQGDANLGLQWHMIAMYGPSFFTGNLITRFGAARIVVVGMILIGLSAAIGLTGVDVAHFWITLILLGLGWNFGFVGASAMILETHRPEEKTRVQALNDFLVFGIVAIGSFSSGSLLTAFGWNTVLLASFGPLAISLVVLLAAPKSHPHRGGDRG